MAKHVLIVDDFAATRPVRVRSRHLDAALLADLHRTDDALGGSAGNTGAGFDLILGDVNVSTTGAATHATVARGVRST